MTEIKCRTVDSRHDFYIIFGDNTYYLFSQKYRKGVDNYYKNGVLLDKALDHSLGKTDKAVHRTMGKLKMYVKQVRIRILIVQYHHLYRDFRLWVMKCLNYQKILRADIT